jgi:Cys-tRNA(Pro) deacylase
VNYKHYSNSSTQKSTDEMNLIAYLKRNNVWFRIIEKKTTVHTADAAVATGIPLEQVTKSLVFLADNSPILVIIPGDCRVDKNKLKSIIKVKNIEMVPFEKAEEYSGYPPGATSPVYHKKIEKVLIDKKVMEFDTVFGGGGSRTKLIELKPEDIQKLNNAIVADIVEMSK